MYSGDTLLLALLSPKLLPTVHMASTGTMSYCQRKCVWPGKVLTLEYLSLNMVSLFHGALCLKLPQLSRTKKDWYFAETVVLLK